MPEHDLVGRRLVHAALDVAARVDAGGEAGRRQLQGGRRRRRVVLRRSGRGSPPRGSTAPRTWCRTASGTRGPPRSSCPAGGSAMRDPVALAARSARSGGRPRSSARLRSEAHRVRRGDDRDVVDLGQRGQAGRGDRRRRRDPSPRPAGRPGHPSRACRRPPPPVRKVGAASAEQRGEQARRPAAAGLAAAGVAASSRSGLRSSAGLFRLQHPEDRRGLRFERCASVQLEPGVGVQRGYRPSARSPSA